MRPASPDTVRDLNQALHLQRGGRRPVLALREDADYLLKGIPQTPVLQSSLRLETARSSPPRR